MKRIPRWLVRIGAALLILVVVLAGAATWFVRRPWPEVSGTLKAAGLSAPVEIIRDRWGMPNIYAQNEHDLVFAQGYVHAQDRLWQMEIIRRVSSGRMSEVMGAGTLPLDRYMRTLGLRRLAQMSWEQYDSESRALLEAYAQGVNSYMDSHRDRLPLEFTLTGINPEPWTPVDTLGWGNLIATNMGFNASTELLRAKIIAKLGDTAAEQLLLHPENQSLVVAPEAQGYRGLRPGRDSDLASVERWLPILPWGSNNWVLNGSRTATGKPLMANDTHLSLYLPSYWYENGLHGGRFNSTGFSFAGIPLVILGHNQQIAWGITNLDGDVQDLYLEKLDDPANPTRYEFKGAWQDLEVVSETIKVKDSAPVELQVRLTRHGPLINDVFGLRDAQPMSQSWTINSGSAIFSAIRKMNAATNWEEFRDALRDWDTLGENFLYADVQGNIGFQVGARLPIRPANHQGLVPMPGWTGEYEWQGFVPFEDLPTKFNPPEGFLVTANNKEPSAGSRYLITNDWLMPSYRANRVTEQLLAGGSATITDAQKLQLDTYMVPANSVRPHMLKIQPKNTLQTKALAEIQAWDLRFSPSSPGALIYSSWHYALVHNTFADELGELAEEYVGGKRHKNVAVMAELMKDPDASWFDDVTTAQRETRDDMLSRSLDQAVDELSQAYGQDPVQWTLSRQQNLSLSHMPFGESGVAPLESLFNSQKVALPGGGETISTLIMVRPASYGVSQRAIFDLQDWDRTLAVNSTGQSGQLFHPNRENQLQMLQRGEYRTAPFSRETVRANAESVLTLVP